MSDGRYTCIWEYEVATPREAEFLTHYAPDGTWARLFARSPGYVGTELYQDRVRPGRFITIDHWRDDAAFRDFRLRFAADYDALDRHCAGLTRHEASLGEFRVVSEVGTLGG